jgi:hypothetical protein
MPTPNKVSIARSRLEVRETVIGTRIAWGPDQEAEPPTQGDPGLSAEPAVSSVTLWVDMTQPKSELMELSIEALEAILEQARCEPLSEAHYQQLKGVLNTLGRLTQEPEKKTGESSTELAYGITSRSPEQADAEQLLKTNRGHWSIENGCHYTIDWNFDEDRGRIRTGHGPENVSRLRRFAVGIIQSKAVMDSVADKDEATPPQHPFGLRLPAHVEQHLRDRLRLTS